jgi:biotin carboxyl carrier protein
MRKFIVNVNGTSYEIEVEEITGGQTGTVAAPAPAAAAPAPAPQAKPQAQKAAPVTATGKQENISAPMPGSIVEVKVKSGDSVKKGGVLMILETMKMENEIVSPRDCRVVSVNVSKGTTINAGDVLCVIE